LLVVLILGMLVSAVTAGPRSARRDGPRDLSEEHHYGEDGEHEHNVQYDHEAFLGKEDSEKFDQLTREEAKRRLGLIVDKVDKDKDGSVSQKELEDWIRLVSKRHVMREAEERFEFHNRDKDGFILEDEFKETMLGKSYNPDEIYDKYRQLTFQQAEERYKRRFAVADKNSDGKLDLEEFADFLHPAETSHMVSIYIDERMEEMDRNKDGKITLEEYIKDAWVGGEGEKEPDWVKAEREHFGKHRDLNKDGTLDKEEVAHMIKPPGYDPAYAESMHLLREADEDKDKSLTKEEILNHQDLFVGSRATNYGNYMKHDEF